MPEQNWVWILPGQLRSKYFFNDFNYFKNDFVLYSLQIRLSDGSRLLGQFNHDHTVGDVRSFIVTARPQYETRPFMLLSTYPSRELNDSETIANAGLLNASIMQKLK